MQRDGDGDSDRGHAHEVVGGGDRRMPVEEGRTPVALRHKAHRFDVWTHGVPWKALWSPEGVLLGPAAVAVAVVVVTTNWHLR